MGAHALGVRRRTPPRRRASPRSIHPPPSPRRSSGKLSHMSAPIAAALAQLPPLGQNLSRPPRARAAGVRAAGHDHPRTPSRAGTSRSRVVIRSTIVRFATRERSKRVWARWTDAHRCGNLRHAHAPISCSCVGAGALLGIAAPHADARPAADPLARASAKSCMPSAGPRGAETIRRNLTNGSEVTEPLSGDGYRITRCDTEGRMTISMTVLPIGDSDGKMVLLPAVTVRRTSIISPTYGDPVRDTRYRDVFRRALPKLLASVLAPTPGRAQRDPAFGNPGPGRHHGSPVGLQRQDAHRKSWQVAREPLHVALERQVIRREQHHPERVQEGPRAVGPDRERLLHEGPHQLHHALRRHDHAARRCQ